MAETKLNLKRCPAPLGGGACGSSVFYDWGLVVMESFSGTSITGDKLQRAEEQAYPRQVKICSRCTTPYIIEDGELLDVSKELSAEDVKAVLARGSTTGPHPRIKDP